MDTQIWYSIVCPLISLKQLSVSDPNSWKSGFKAFFQCILSPSKLNSCPNPEFILSQSSPNSEPILPQSSANPEPILPQSSN
ncbi:hypothetical protein NP233_g8185 [Leucocoprinus birnbaumii]|uniref:Uncharacterized protein n=1 Tax=Leucocoprinus birnbaumii TaxID=56174 RepID=A0AAD5VMZ6_9AGAR|nr:hypothetical protein NP233_g8185 [Leucocoprinus birnbaumii]